MHPSPRSSRPPKKKAVPIRWRRLILGYLFIFLGFLGLFLPFLQGILFLLIGLVFLKDHAPWAYRLTHAFQQKYPKYRKMSTQIEQRIDDFFAKIGLG